MPRRIDTEAVINAVRLDEQAGDPAQPAAGFWLVYMKAGGLYIQDSAGVVTGPLGTGGGDVATDPIWDAAGDIVQGTGADAAARLAIGTAYQLPRVNSGATALEYVSAGRVLISQQTPSGTNTVTFDSIPQIYKTLEIEYVARSTEVATSTIQIMWLNNDTTATDYRHTTRYGYASVSEGTDGAANMQYGRISGANSPAGSCGAGFMKVMDYRNTTFNTQVLGRYSLRYDDSASYQLTGHWSAEWENTAAVTRVDLVISSGNYVAGSEFRLYGVF